VLVRCWNLFHGNTVPPGRHAYLGDEIELATADDPDILCVQEVPAWALGRFTVGDVAARPTLGPLPIPAEVGHRITDLNHGLLRSAFAGQGNAMQLAPRLRVLDHRVLTLNSRRFRGTKARELDLDLVARLSWAKERRIVQAIRVAVDGRQLVVANLHCTSYHPDQRLAEAELLRAAWFTVSLARPEDVVILAGDFNVTAVASQTLRDLSGPEWGFSAPGPGIDHILVRGASVSPIRRWDDARRRHGDVLLSDHAPVELDVQLAS
jgi:endonuclease/exonuclease/phosphatase family metal-dependent hydrolase